MAKAQIGFIDFVIKPSYQLLVKVLPACQTLIDHLDTNKEKWTGLFEEYEGKMQDSNDYFQKEIEEKGLPGCKRGFKVGKRLSAPRASTVAKVVADAAGELKEVLPE